MRRRLHAGAGELRAGGGGGCAVRLTAALGRPALETRGRRRQRRRSPPARFGAHATWAAAAGRRLPVATGSGPPA
jgi:hypothetical protein